MLNILLAVVFVALATGGAQGATSQDVATLQVIASDLGIPRGFWNSSVDPCSGKWPGVGCCTGNSTKACCTSPAQLYDATSLNLDCETSSDATISVLLLRSDLINMTLNGTLSGSVCNLSLLLLDIGFNNIGGTIPACLGTLSMVRVLRLGGNRLNGTIPPELGNLLNLEELFLDSLELSGGIPVSLGNLKKLTRLVLRNNHLQGPIPAELGQLSALNMLLLQVNNFSGNIPSNMSNLAVLDTLGLAKNNLTGQLDATTFNGMQSLQTLNLSSNGFSGSIPDLAISGLTLLNLGFNMFTGSIPSFQASPGIVQLFLGHNSLTGGIPADFAATSMNMLDISHNQLSGPVDRLSSIGGSGTIQINIAFNFFQNASSLFDGPSKGQTYFNCAPGPNCGRSSPGRTQMFAVNAGGEQVKSMFDFDADLSPNSLGLFYDPSLRWAVELSGTLGDVFQDSTRSIQRATETEQVLYQSMRWSSSYIAYHGVGLESGNYTVTLHFAEIIFDQVGYREFDVLLNGQVWKRRLDVVKEAGGPNIAYNISNTTNVNNGTLSVELQLAAKDMYLLAGKYKVENLGPMISAISVVHEGFDGSSNSNSNTRIGVPVAIASLLVVLIFLGFFLWFWKRRRLTKQKQQAEAQSHPTTLSTSDLDISGVFTYEELYQATEGFSEPLGEGGFGIVFKGKLSNGVTIAVKQLIRHENKQVEEDFKREISLLSKVRHRNLLSVLGYSLESDVPMLVTEFMPNGSLDKWILRQRSGASSEPLDWESRRSVAIGIASGLAYLHEESKYRIIHCDIKPANILLDSNMNPRLADFGLARLYDEKASHVTATRLKGTAGYLAPEYAMHLQLSDKVDVYSFGVVLLELLSGRRAVDFSAPSEQCVLVDWVHKEAEFPANLLEIVDKRLGSNYNEDEARDMTTVAILCTQRKPAMRPKMQSVWLMLNGTVKLPEVLARLDAVVQTSSSSAEVSNSFEDIMFGFVSSSSQSRTG